MNSNSQIFKNAENKKREKNNFFNYIKYTEDPEKKELIKVQEKLEKMEINKENIYLLTKDLSKTQKNKLLEMYKEQINSLNININNYKRKIVKINTSLQS